MSLEASPSLSQATKDSQISNGSVLADDMPADLQKNLLPSHAPYRLYKQRFFGLLGLVLLNIVSAMSWPWFGPISNNMVRDFGISLDEVNWLGNIMGCIYLPTALLIPKMASRYGISNCCKVGAVALVLSAWIRFAGTSRSLPPRNAYALLMFGQFFASIAQPIYQVLGPKYSETWFDLRGRTTATMIIAISNPVGGALGQLISPLVGDSRRSILVLGIISTVAAPATFLIGRAPPTPPTYSGSKPSPSLTSLIRAMLGMAAPREAWMSVRERLDFALIILIFSFLVAATNTFSILSAQDLQPSGYSDDVSGFMGACLLLAGIVGAIASAPLFDRVFTHHLAITTKVLVPFVGAGWFSLIWAVRPNNTAALFVIMGVIGVSSLTMLPVALELACELTRNADASSALLWFVGNLMNVVFVLVQGALRAGPDANPPLNMHKALIFNGVSVLVASSTVFLIEGKQARRELDEQMNQEAVRLQPLEGDKT